MPVATSPSVACPSSVVKMEDRKRSAIGLDELAPPSKRQHLNGGGKSKDKDDGLDPKDEAWIEDYQKDAIYRQMLEYKREKTTLEARLEKVERRSASHQDHVKRNDGWIIQLLQELELLADSTLSLHSTSEAFSYPALPQLEDGQLERQLEDRSRKVKTRVEELLERIAATRASVSPEVADLEKQLKSLLNKEKDFVVQIQHLNSEKDNLSEQLDAATLRYIKAEKKLDRAKSAQVQKLEQQAIATATSRPSNVENGVDPSEQNGRNEALESQFREASAVLAKQKEQLESAFAEIKGLQEENSTFKARRESLSEEDYARTDVFKLFKGQNEDLIKRINHLEATNKQLREEAEKLQAERTAFRTKLEEETLKDTMDLEDAVQVKESDLTRIRSARDELLADNAIRKASQEQEHAAHEHIKELSSAKDDRIQALESELGRLRPQEDAAMSTPREDLEALSVSDLRERFIKLEKDYASIQSELPSMEKAYKKAIGLAQKKVWDYAGLEERVSVLAMEKSKADQKYFAARKDADIRNLEIRSLRHQNGKSSEIIASLKEVETQNRSLVSNLEKQVVTYKQSNTALMEENKTMKSTASDAVRRADGSKAQISDLINLVKSKDATNAAVKEQAAAHETETERLRTRLDHVQKDRDEWKSKCYSNSSAEEEMLRNLALCTVCRNNFKNTAIKACGHLFCHDCVEARLSNRMRKCPTCSKGFDKSDVMTVHM